LSDDDDDDDDGASESNQVMRGSRHIHASVICSGQRTRKWLSDSASALLLYRATFSDVPQVKTKKDFGYLLAP